MSQCPPDAQGFPGVTGEVFLVASNPNIPSTTIQTRATAAASAGFPNPGHGCTATLTFTAPRDQWYGLVFVDKWRNGIGVRYTVS